MKVESVYFSSITHAMKIKKQLLKNNIDAKLIKYSGINKNEGCGYGLSFNGADYFSVISILKDFDIPYSLNKI